MGNFYTAFEITDCYLFIRGCIFGNALLLRESFFKDAFKTPKVYSCFLRILLWKEIVRIDFLQNGSGKQNQAEHMTTSASPELETQDIFGGAYKSLPYSGRLFIFK